MWFFVWKICYQSPQLLREKNSEFATFRQWLVSCSTAFSKFRFLNIFFFNFLKYKGWCNLQYCYFESLCYFCCINFIVVTTPKKFEQFFWGQKKILALIRLLNLLFLLEKDAKFFYITKGWVFFFLWQNSTK